METIYETNLTVALVKGLSKKGTEFTAVKIGDSLVFDYRLVQSLLVKYLKEVKSTK